MYHYPNSSITKVAQKYNGEDILYINSSLQHISINFHWIIYFEFLKYIYFKHVIIFFMSFCYIFLTLNGFLCLNFICHIMKQRCSNLCLGMWPKSWYRIYFELSSWGCLPVFIYHRKAIPESPLTNRRHNHLFLGLILLNWDDQILCSLFLLLIIDTEW